MGDVADLMLEGVVCQECGDLVGGGDAVGYPRYCRRCSSAARKTVGKTKLKQHRCLECSKKFRTQAGLNDHTRDMHSG